jgi:hypothetical protein
MPAGVLRAGKTGVKREEGGVGFPEGVMSGREGEDSGLRNEGYDSGAVLAGRVRKRLRLRLRLRSRDGNGLRIRSRLRMRFWILSEG